MGEFIVTIGAVEIGPAQYGIPLRLILKSGGIQTADHDIGVLDSFKTFCPIPAVLAFHIILGSGRKHLVIEVHQRTAFVGFPMYGNICGVHFRQDRSAVRKEFVAHITFTGNQCRIQTGSIYIGVFGSIKR